MSIIKKADNANNDLLKIVNIINDIEKKLLICNDINNKTKKDINININNIYAELKYEELTHLDLNSLEFIGYYNNNIIQSYEIEEEKLHIKNMGYEYTLNNNNIINLNLLLTASNDKKYNFLVKQKQYKNDINVKLSFLKNLLNQIYLKDTNVSKSKLFFILPISFYLSNTIKIEQVLNNNINMEEDIYDYCLQKNGYPSNFTDILYDEENKQKNIKNNINEIIFEKMCECLPQDSLKSFVHKIIMNYDDLFIYRKNFINSFSIQSFLNYLITDKMFLSNMFMNKYTGDLFINNNIINFVNNDLDEIMHEEEKNKILIRLSKNISYFMSQPGIYGVLPHAFYVLANSLINREKKVINIFELIFGNKSDNYFFKLKYLINKNKNNEDISDDDDDNNDGNNMEIEEENKKENDINDSLTRINKIIDGSIDENNLKKEDIELKLWF